MWPSVGAPTGHQCVESQVFYHPDFDQSGTPNLLGERPRPSALPIGSNSMLQIVLITLLPLRIGMAISARPFLKPHRLREAHEPACFGIASPDYWAAAVREGSKLPVFSNAVGNRSALPEPAGACWRPLAGRLFHCPRPNPLFGRVEVGICRRWEPLRLLLHALACSTTLRRWLCAAVYILFECMGNLIHAILYRQKNGADLDNHARDCTV